MRKINEDYFLDKISKNEIECFTWIQGESNLFEGKELNNIQYKDTYCKVFFTDNTYYDFFPDDIYQSIQLARFDAYDCLLDNLRLELLTKKL